MNLPILNEEPSQNISIEPAHTDQPHLSHPNIIQTSINATFEQRLLPGPSEMKEYEELYPGFTKKYIGLIKSKSQHRIFIEKREQAHRHRQQDAELENAIYGFRFCLYFAAVIICVLIIAAIVFVCFGKKTEAIIAIILPAFGILTGIISRFIGRKRL